jgi:cell division protein FtsL
MADSPYVSELTDKKEKNTKEKNTKETDEKVKGNSFMSFKYAAIVVAVLVVIMILYYAFTCYSGNSKVCKKSNSKSNIPDKIDAFSVEAEVDKLRIKQDEFKTRL